MRKPFLRLNDSQKKRASTLLAIAQSAFEAAGSLFKEHLYKDAAVHLEAACSYASNAVLVHRLKSKPSPKVLGATLRRVYGRHKSFPGRYIDLQARLHQMRADLRLHAPSRKAVKKELEVLGLYLKFIFKVVPRWEIKDILEGIVEGEAQVQDLSFDVYCPKTYVHHVRATIWQPPYYLDIFSHQSIVAQIKGAFAALGVSKNEDYVIGLNSRVDQYADNHLLMLDIDGIHPQAESALKKVGGILLRSGRGYHFIGDRIISGRRNWERALKRLMKEPRLRKYLDKEHVKISLNRGYSTLRISSSKIKPVTPYFYKHV